MWTRLVGWLRDVLFGVVPEPQPEPLPAYNVPEEWIFSGEKPSNEVIHKLNTGYETIGDHIVYRSQDTGRLAGSVEHDGVTYLAKELTYWIAGGAIEAGRQYLSIRTTCGLQRCVRPDHLKLKYAPSKTVVSKKKAQPKLVVNRVKGPPEYVKPAKPKLTMMSKEELLSGDRTICPSSKVFFATLEEVQAKAYFYNTHYRPAGQPRLYGYDCDWCAGNHFTHKNPKKHKHIHKGSWS